MSKWQAFLPLMIPVLQMGKSQEVIGDLNIISSIVVPRIVKDPALLKDQSKLLAELADLAKTGQLEKLRAAIFSLAGVMVALLQNENTRDDAMSFLKTLG